MSLQVCHCGWSKVTTYQGLRTHQGKMGCTPKGMSIPKSDQFMYKPKLTYVGPSINIEEPWQKMFNSSIKSDPADSDVSLQVCYCGWSKMTTYQGLRTHQGKMGCTPKGMRIPEEVQYTRAIEWPGPQWRDSRTTQSTTVKKENVPVTPNLLTQREARVLEMIKLLCETQQDSLQMASDDAQQALDFASGAQHVQQISPSLMPLTETFITQANLTATDAKVLETNGTLFGIQQHSWKRPSDATGAGLGFGGGAQQPFLMPETFITQVNPTPTEAKMPETKRTLFGGQQDSWKPVSDNMYGGLVFGCTAPPLLMPVTESFTPQANSAATNVNNRTLFETPPRSHQTATKACRALDFSNGAQQTGQLAFDFPTAATQETETQLMKEAREKEREAQKLQKAKQDRIKADFQQKIQTREQKIAEVISAAKACKGGLDAEWVEINDVFSAMARVVEDTRRKALQPLEERRQQVKREAQDLVQKLQKEIDELKRAVDEMDKNPDLQAPPPTGPAEPRDWKSVTVNISVSFGTLRSMISNMRKQIQQELQNFSSVELKRVSTFEVDVKLDPTTAHRCLILSPDGKTVSDGGNRQKVVDAAQSFDMFGSILGLNRLTSGRSYWEVEVGNKTGWDLGVARRSANRKGNLSLRPENGYWVAVHYEGEKYAALSTPPVSLALRAKPRRVGVFVDYKEGLVSFYDVTARSHIYSFTECAFREEISPYFSPHLTQNGKNSDPLIISALTKQ